MTKDGAGIRGDGGGATKLTPSQDLIKKYYCIRSVKKGMTRKSGRNGKKGCGGNGKATKRGWGLKLQQN